MRWPFPDEHAFWAWARDPDAELMEQDEDLLLWSVDGLPLLVAAAADPACAKQEVCEQVLGEFARALVRPLARAADPDRPSPGWAVVREAALREAGHPSPVVREWSRYVLRLHGYRETTGPVDRARVRRMAADLLSTPWAERRRAAAGGPDRLVVTTTRTTWTRRLWCCHVPDHRPDHLYVDRRTGRTRVSRGGPLTRQELRDLF